MATLRWISTSSNDFATAANWSTGSAPVTGDTIIFDATGNADVTTTLDQHLVTGVTVYVYASFTGKIGTLAAPLQIGATLVRIGDAQNGTIAGLGSGRLNFDFGSSNCKTIVLATSQQSADGGLAPVRIKGGGATSSLYAYSGIVDVATNAVGDTATLATVNIQPQTGTTQTNAKATVFLSSGCTLTTINQASGTLTVNSAVTTLNQSGGNGTVCTVQGSGTLGASQIGGTLYYNSTGNITTPSVLAGGKLDFSKDAQAKTVSSGINLYADGTVNLDNGVKNSITNSTGIILQGCRLADVTIGNWAGNTVVLS